MEEVIILGREYFLFLSLYIPTNGIVEWVIAALDSICGENINNEKFEVIVTDNGNDMTFEALMSDYEKSIIIWFIKKQKRLCLIIR